jgi:hypothetical protein
MHRDSAYIILQFSQQSINKGTFCLFLFVLFVGLKSFKPRSLLMHSWYTFWEALDEPRCTMLVPYCFDIYMVEKLLDTFFH